MNHGARVEKATTDLTTETSINGAPFCSVAIRVVPQNSFKGEASKWNYSGSFIVTANSQIPDSPVRMKFVIRNKKNQA
jgi:hypothetical protein